MEKQGENREDPVVAGRAVRFGPYALDTRSGKLLKHGLNLKLSGQPFEILSMLVARPGELVTREELRQRLWPGDIYVDFERSLNSAVKKLRGALQDDPQKPRFIETQPRKGYRFIGVIESEVEAGESAPPQESIAANLSATSPPGLSNNIPAPADSASQAQSFDARPIPWKWIVAVALATVIIFSVLAIRRTKRAGLPAKETASSKPTSFRSSIAVLGFKNLSSRHDADWLSIAIAQMLSTELASGGKIRIIPEETVSRAKLDLGLKEKDGYPRDSLRALRADLGSDYVVAGSYVALGERNSGQVRIDLRLQETISGETLASIAVSGNQSEIFDLVVRAGREMRAKFGSAVPPEGDVDWRTVLPSNREAARLYSEGLAHLRVFENLAASEALQKSVAIDAHFALGHAALAQAYSALGSDARAVASAQKALSLSSSLPEDERLEIEGRYYELIHDWVGAIGAYRHLWQDFPDDIESALRLAAAQTSAGKLNDAVATLSSLRAGPASQRSDPRIDLAEASIAARNADYRRQQALAEQAATMAQSQGARLLLARAQLVKGWALDDQSRLKEALEAYSAARQAFEGAGDRDGTATALNDVGIVLQKQGDLTAARQTLEQARDLFRQVGDENGFGSALTNLGEVYRAQGDLTQAEDLYREALTIFRASGRKENEYATMNNLGDVLYQLGDFRGARKIYEDLIEVRKTSGDRNGVAFARINLAEVLRIQGELNRALTLYPQALATFKEVGDRSDATAVQRGFARALMVTGNLAAARQVLTEALATDQAIGAKGDAALDRITLAELTLEEGHPEQVEPQVRVNLDPLREEQRTDDEIEAAILLTRASLAQRNTPAAAAAFQPAATLAAKRSDWLVRFRVAVTAARLLAAEGHLPQAARALEDASHDAKQMGCAGCDLEARLALGEVRIQEGHSQSGRAQLQAVIKDAREKGFLLVASRASRVNN